MTTTQCVFLHSCLRTQCDVCVFDCACDARACAILHIESLIDELSGDRNSAVMIEIRDIPSSAQIRDVGG